MQDWVKLGTDSSQNFLVKGVSDSADNDRNSTLVFSHQNSRKMVWICKAWKTSGKSLETNKKSVTC